MEETESKEKTEGAVEDSIISLFLTVDDMKICGRPFVLTNRFTSFLL